MPPIVPSWPLLADAAALALLLVYHLFLAHTARRHPERTVIGRNRFIREAWLREIMARRADLLAVQTLRNWTMTATFLASTAMLIAIGIVHFIFVNQPGVRAASEILRADYAETKLLLLAGLFFTAFFCFAQTLRALNHLGFEAAVVDEATFAGTLAHLHRQANAFTLGMRGYYLSLPFALWLFGSAHFLAGSVVLLLLLRRLDFTAAGDPGA
ncbi:MAG: DUF599 domain-containing protein [Gammaproteobacteria bacterium]